MLNNKIIITIIHRAIRKLLKFIKVTPNKIETYPLHIMKRKEVQIIQKKIEVNAYILENTYLGGCLNKGL